MQGVQRKTLDRRGAVLMTTPISLRTQTQIMIGMAVAFAAIFAIVACAILTN
jgi:hypothetical protein